MCLRVGESFIILAPLTKSNSIIYGRNSIGPLNESSEVVYFSPSTNENNIKVIYICICILIHKFVYSDY